MALPFALGIAVSLGLYRLQNDPSVAFSSFLLFLGVAVSITAFPVLARILAELKLLGTKVGAITMAAGLINDCTAWVLLALVVSLLNASGGLEALYVFLTTVAFALFLIFLIRPLYYRLCIYTNSFENGPTHLLMTVTLLMVLISAFITNIIGVHAIFGGFLAGVIIPHENNLPIRITEKIEDIMNIVFLPLYFTLSGLKTQIGLLNSGLVWGYVVLVIVVACFGKIAGCTVAAKLSGLSVRESFAIGFLMNCKGLVELIVLNIGLDAGVLNDQVFVILVVMALITTIMTTPLVLKVYPPSVRDNKPLTQAIQDKSGGEKAAVGSEEKEDNEGGDDEDKKEDIIQDISTKKDPSLSMIVDNDAFTMITVLNKLETVPAVMALIRLLKRDDDIIKSSPHIHAIRLLELTQRPSDVMKIQDIQETLRIDPVLSVIRTFGSLIGIRLSTHLDFAAPLDFVERIGNHYSMVGANMILLPWKSKQSINNNISTPREQEINPFDHSFLPSPSTTSSPTTPMTRINGMYQLSDAEFAKQAFTLNNCTIGLFLDRGFGNINDGDHVQLQKVSTFQIIVPFFGGKDDRAALLFALRLQMYRHADVLILHKKKTSPTNDNNDNNDNENKNRLYANSESVKTCLATSTLHDHDGDSDDDKDQNLLATLFDDTYSTFNVSYQPVDEITPYTLSQQAASTSSPLGKHDLIVLGRRIEENNNNKPTHSHSTVETPGSLYSKEFKVALGYLAYDLISSGIKSSLIVIQAQSNKNNHRPQV
ncbi:Sodium/hydrogen exchanger family-domain-containing protein [Cunninghamella echinulata]|nr:Sodium/hydrogen exchanger family-domain-containing protein [Cunninghamella echinulata]